MWGVFNDYGQVADFDEKSEAVAFAAKENAYDPDSHWVLFVSVIGGSGYPKG
jgi:hypothetical protein